MSLLNGIFIFKNRMIGPISVDAVIRESHKSTLRITHNPVEFGASINDHAIIEPKEYEMEGVVSNLPDKWFQFSPPDFLSGTSQTRSSSAFEKILLLQQTREPINIQTGLKLYNNMLIESFDVSQDNRTAGGLYFTAKLKEVIIVKNKSATEKTSNTRGKTRNDNAPRIEQGKTQGEKVPAEPGSREYQRIYKK